MKCAVISTRTLAVLLLSARGLFWMWTSQGAPLVHGNDHSVPAPREDLGRAKRASGLQVVRPADVPIALLADYYEHGIEHAPPREAGGVMQHRERFYRAPADPFELIRSRLTATPSDAALRAALDAWQSSWRQGRVDNAGDCENLQRLASASSLGADVLLETGRGLNFLAGDELAAAFYRAALEHAAQQYRGVGAGDPAALPLLRQLEQTAALWRLKDYSGLAQRFALAEALYPPLSVESRRAGYLRAFALYSDGSATEAADLIVQIDDQHHLAGDLGAFDKSDIEEMDWVSGLYLAAAKRYEQAIPYFQDLLQCGGPRTRPAVAYLASCLRHLARDAEADALRARYPVPASQPTTRPTTLGPIGQFAPWEAMRPVPKEVVCYG